MKFLQNVIRHAFLFLYFFVAISPSLPANAAAPYIEQCSDFVGKDNHYSVAVDQHMLSHYTNGITDQSEVFKISELIREDKLCIQLAAQEYKLNRMRDGASKEATRKQLLEIQGRYNEIVEERRQEEERTKRMAGMYGKITEAFYEEDFKVNKVLIDTRYKIIDMMGETLVTFEKELAEKQEVLVDELSVELKKLSGKSDTELLEKKQELDLALRKKIEPLKRAFEENKTIYKNQLEQITNEKQEIQIAAYRKYADETFPTSLEYENAVKNYEKVLEERQTMYAKRSDQLFEATNVPLDILFDEIEGVIGDMPIDTSAYNQVIFMRDVVSNGHFDTRYAESTKEVIDGRIFSDREIMLKLMAAMTSVEFSLRSILQDTEQTQKIIIAVEKGDSEMLLKFVKELPQSIRKKIDAAYEGQYESIATEIEASQLLLEKILEDPNLSDKAAEALKLDFDILKKEGESIGIVDTSVLDNSGFTEDVNIYLKKIMSLYGGYPDYLVFYIKRFEEKNRFTKAKALYASVAATYEELNELIEDLPRNQQNLLRFSVLHRLTDPLSQRKIIQISVLGNITFTSAFEDEVRLFTLKEERNSTKYEKMKHDRETETHIVAGLLWGENIVEKKILDLDAAVGINLDKNKIIKMKLRIQASSEGPGSTIIVKKGRIERFVYSKDGYDYYMHQSEKLLIKRKGTVVKKIYKYDSNNRVIWEVDNLGILIFYGYYQSTNQVAAEMKVIAHHFYNPVTGGFDQPRTTEEVKKLYEKDKDTGKYRMITLKRYVRHFDGRIKSIQELSPLKRGGMIIGKNTQYTYLDEEITEKNQQQGNDLRTTFYDTMLHSSLPLVTKFNLYPQMLSSVTITNLKGEEYIKNDFYYDRLMRLAFIEEREVNYMNRRRIIKSSEIDTELIKKDYPDLNISEEFQMMPYSHETKFRQTNPKLFMDSNGEILSYPTKLPPQQYEEMTQFLQSGEIDTNALLGGRITEIDTILSNDARDAERRAQAIADQRESSGILEDTTEFMKGVLDGFWMEAMGDLIEMLRSVSIDMFWAIISGMGYIMNALWSFVKLVLANIVHALEVFSKMAEYMAEKITKFVDDAPDLAANLIETIKSKWKDMKAFAAGSICGRLLVILVPTAVFVSMAKILSNYSKILKFVVEIFQDIGYGIEWVKDYMFQFVKNGFKVIKLTMSETMDVLLERMKHSSDPTWFVDEYNEGGKFKNLVKRTIKYLEKSDYAKQSFKKLREESVRLIDKAKDSKKFLFSTLVEKSPSLDVFVNLRKTNLKPGYLEEFRELLHMNYHELILPKNSKKLNKFFEEIKKLNRKRKIEFEEMFADKNWSVHGNAKTLDRSKKKMTDSMADVTNGVEPLSKQVDTLAKVKDLDRYKIVVNELDDFEGVYKRLKKKYGRKKIIEVKQKYTKGIERTGSSSYKTSESLQLQIIDPDTGDFFEVQIKTNRSNIAGEIEHEYLYKDRIEGALTLAEKEDIQKMYMVAALEDLAHYVGE